MQTRQHRNREKGASLFVAIAALVWVIIPMLGLVVDLGILYSAKARLQAAVDGAALAAARALNLGATTSAQQTSAEQNAVNWFYANFPNGNWGTSGTVMTTANVTVVNSPNNANLRQVTVTASTSVPTWFMKYLGFSATNLTSSGQASRKDLVAMLVLDRSGSMCAVNGVAGGQPCSLKKNPTSACAAMITAAKIFTGFFAEGRDQIGLLTFSDGYYLDSKPTTDFQTLFGYTNSTSGTGMLDNITCGGGTGTAAAVSLAYNELYKIAEPGAMNLIMLETDGLPNTLIYNYYATPGTTNTLALNSTSGCVDSTSNTTKTIAQGGWKTAASVRQWIPGIPMNTGGAGYLGNVPAGAIGGFYTSDPAEGTYITVLFNPIETQDDNDTSSNTNSLYVTATGAGATALGCNFNSYANDFNWLPGQDVFGNQVAPPNEYQALALTNIGGVNANNLTGIPNTDWPHTHAAALNATDNSAYNVRTNATLPAYVFVIGLGGNSGNPPDPVLLQRMANDPNPDQFNSPAAYPVCASEPTCITYPSQPQGQFIYSPTPAQLAQAFLSISSQILRLSH